MWHLRLLALLLLIGPLQAQAEEPRSRELQQIAISWLSAVDSGNAPAIFEGLTAEARKDQTAVRVQNLLSAQRAPLGKMTGRLVPAVDRKSGYVVVFVQSGWEHEEGKIVFERVTLKPDPDGRWRVAGYLVRVPRGQKLVSAVSFGDAR